MAKNKTCEFCGKEGIDGRHVNMCGKNPKNLEPEVVPEIIEEIPAPEVIEPIAEESVPSHIEVALPKSDMKCPDCGEDARRLNATDYRCLKCGDREFKKR